MEHVLQQLANLQYIDSRIDEITQLRGDLPEEILDIETDLSRSRAKIRQLEDELQDLVNERTRLNHDIELAGAKVTRYEDQQLSVRNNREYDALTKEIEAQRQLEKDSIFRLEEIAAREALAKEELAEKKATLEKTETKLEEKKVNLDKVVEDTEAEEKNLLEKRSKVEAGLEERYLKSYNRLRQGLSNGIAVVAMKDGAAFGMQLPPQSQVEVTRRNKIVIDESTGRIVVDPSFFDEARKTFNL
jgi:predicted  nucleic acid-binding Zn-ribbon protein